MLGVALLAGLWGCGDGSSPADASHPVDSIVVVDTGGSVDGEGDLGVSGVWREEPFLLTFALIRWDDEPPAICLADRVVGNECGFEDTTDKITLVARYLVHDDGSADLSLTQTNLYVFRAGDTEDWLLATDGSITFSEYNLTSQMARGTIDVTFGSDAVASGSFVVED